MHLRNLSIATQEERSFSSPEQTGCGDSTHGPFEKHVTDPELG